MEKTRDSNLELLRILAAMGVIILHINLRMFPKMECGDLNIEIMYLSESLCIGAVNIFLLISGYFMWRLNVRFLWKPIEMVAELITIKIIFYILSIMIRHQMLSFNGMIHTLLPDNYYVIFYIALYFASLYYNLVIQKLSYSEMKSCVIVLFVIFSLWPTFVDIMGDISKQEIINLSTITREGSAYGYNIVHFSFMYMLGGYFGSNRDRKYSNNMLAVSFVTSVVLITVWAHLAHGNNGFSLGTEYSYCNPLVIINAISLFLLFVQWKWKTKNIINRFAKASFTVYLLHGWIIGLLPLEVILKLPSFIMIVVMVFSLIMIFVICWLFHECWDYITRPIFKKLRNISFVLSINSNK